MNPYTPTRHERDKSLKVKEWAIDRLKGGYSPRRIAEDIQRLFSEKVTMMTVYRWKKQYITATGKEILPWRKLNPTTEQRNKNKWNPV